MPNWILQHTIIALSSTKFIFEKHTVELKKNSTKPKNIVNVFSKFTILCWVTDMLELNKMTEPERDSKNHYGNTKVLKVLLWRKQQDKRKAGTLESGTLLKFRLVTVGKSLILCISFYFL